MRRSLCRGILLTMLSAVCAVAQSPGMLVSDEWLAGHLKDPSVVVLHVGSPADYAAGHIPGARLITLADISVTGPGGLRLELPPVASLEQAFGRLGVSDSSRVVIYPGTESVQSATRVWFTLDYLGAGDRAALLDGGLSVWRAAGRPVTTETAQVAAQSFTAHPRPAVLAKADWLRTHLKDPKVQVLDARASEFYTGANAGNMPRAGHLPGAASVPFTAMLDGQRKLLPPADLKRLLGTSADQQAVAYCHIGQQATVLYFVGRYLGSQPLLYDGSFQEWSNRPELPVETAAPDSRRP